MRARNGICAFENGGQRMVGVQDVHSVTPKQMLWLRRGGRERLYELFREMEEKLRRLGLLGDFYGTIWLPTDIIVVAFGRGCVGVSWTFDEDEKDEAERFAEEIRRLNPEAEVQVETARDHMEMEEGTIITDFTWHGDEGASLIFRMVDDILQAVEEAGEVERLEVIKDIEGRRIRLPLFVPKLPESKMLERAAERCDIGDYVLLPDKRVYRRAKGGLREATPAEIAELTLL